MQTTSERAQEANFKGFLAVPRPLELAIYEIPWYGMPEWGLALSYVLLSSRESLVSRDIHALFLPHSVLQGVGW